LRKLFAAASFAVTLLVCGSARSETFSYSDTLVSFQNTYLGTVAGTFDIDTAAGTITGSSFTVTIGGTLYSFSGGPSQQAQDRPDLYQATFRNAESDDFVLALPVASLTNYGGGKVCSVVTPCTLVGESEGPGTLPVLISNPTIFNNSGISSVLALAESGSLVPPVPVAIAPEPSSFILLGSGLLGAFGVVRRRFAA
jgi:hypothetical protein